MIGVNIVKVCCMCYEILKEFIKKILNLRINPQGM